MNFFWVFFGGGCGAALRYGIGKLITNVYAGNFPLATLIANTISCIILGFVMVKLTNLSLNENTKMFLIIGVCGGLSTFSTFSFETFELLKNGQWLWACLNVVVSVITCLLILLLIYKAQP